jgi:hypothetical protein
LHVVNTDKRLTEGGGEGLCGIRAHTKAASNSWTSRKCNPVDVMNANMCLFESHSDSTRHVALVRFNSYRWMNAAETFVEIMLLYNNI